MTLSIQPSTALEVSVVLCSYNGEKYIEEQIRSILAQTYPLKEVLVVDDCSTDTTVTIVKQLAEQYPVLSIHQNQCNLGHNKNFEKALQLAKADIIAISDQDDVWHPQKIEILLKSWSPPALLIYGASVIFERDIPERLKPKRIIRKVAGSDPRKLSLYNTISGHNMMLKKELVTLSLPFEKEVHYDWWMAVVACCNRGVIYEPSVLVYQRAHEDNLTVKPLPTKVADYKTMLLPHLEKFQTAPNMPVEYRHFFQKFHELIADSLNKKNKWRLFIFLLTNRKLIYYYKKRPFEIISHVKHSYAFAFKKLDS